MCGCETCEVRVLCDSGSGLALGQYSNHIVKGTGWLPGMRPVGQSDGRWLVFLGKLKTASDRGVGFFGM